MLFNSFEFIFLFLPVTWVLFRLVIGFGGGLPVALLGIASLGFYAWWDVRFVGLLLGSIGFNYVGGRLISGAVSRGDKETARKSLAVSIAANLVLLGYCKYANFFLDTLRSLGVEVGTPVSVVLPLGISFFTFTQVAFLVDVYRGLASEYRFSKYLLFVTYFPHLIAGPILHHKEMISQFDRLDGVRLRPRELAMGLSIFTIGLAKKVLIADQIATVPQSIFAMATQTELNLIEAWCGALGYTLQLYFDFSGYCDMAIGISLLFGIRLPINFNSPYKARNIIDFWRRWHMTLSRFLRDYLYIPLGGNRLGAWRRQLNLAITMLLGGLWHGAAWTFVAWGALHGAYLAINHAWRTARVSAVVGASPWWNWVAWALTFVAVVVAWVFFRADTFETAWRILSAMFGGGRGLVLPDGARDLWPVLGQVLDGMKSVGIEVTWGRVNGALHSALWIPPLLLIVLFLPNSQELFSAHRVAIVDDAMRVRVRKRWSLRWRSSALWALGLACLGVVSVLSLHRASEFLYYQF